MYTRSNRIIYDTATGEIIHQTGEVISSSVPVKHIIENINTEKNKYNQQIESLKEENMLLNLNNEIGSIM